MNRLYDGIFVVVVIESSVEEQPFSISNMLPNSLILIP